MKDKQQLILNGIIVLFVLFLAGLTLLFVKPIGKFDSKLEPIPGPVPVPPLEFGIHGSGTIGVGLMPELINGFIDAGHLSPWPDNGHPADPVDPSTKHYYVSKDNRKIHLYVQSLHSGPGANDLISNSKCVISMASADQKELDIEGYNKEMIAGDGICVFVNKATGVTKLTLKQLAQIYGTSKGNWKAYGGKNLEITPLNHKNGSGTRKFFEYALYGSSEKDNPLLPEGYKIKFPEYPKGTKDTKKEEDNPLILGDFKEMIKSVQKKPGAIGFASMETLYNLSQYPDVTLVAVDDMLPTRESIQSENYAITRRLFLYTRTKPETDNTVETLKHELLEFIKSPSGQTIVAKAGFIDRNIGLSNENLPNPTQDAPEAYNKAYARAKKVVSNIRFAKNVSTVYEKDDKIKGDIKGTDDISRIASYIRDRANEIKNVYVFGFSDDVGSSIDKRRKSEERASMVNNKLEEKLQTNEATKNISVIPVGCSDSSPIAPKANTDPDREKNRQKNRRVEIWIEFKKEASKR